MYICNNVVIVFAQNYNTAAASTGAAGNGSALPAAMYLGGEGAHPSRGDEVSRWSQMSNNSGTGSAAAAAALNLLYNVSQCMRIFVIFFKTLIERLY